MKIAVGGFQHETNTFSDTLATFDEFARHDSWPGLTRGEACDLTGILNQSACARLSELMDGGFVVVRGTREGPFGDQVHVYRATERGMARAKVLRDMTP